VGKLIARGHNVPTSNSVHSAQHVEDMLADPDHFKTLNQSRHLVEQGAIPMPQKEMLALNERQNTPVLRR
jgi:hypothetical protein